VPARLDAALVNVRVDTDVIGVAPGSGFCVFTVGRPSSADAATVTDARAVMLPIVTRAVAATHAVETVVRVYDLAFEATLKSHVTRLRAETGSARTADCARVGALVADDKMLEKLLGTATQRFVIERIGANNRPQGAMVNDGTRTRYLYAPEILQITPSLQPPAVDASSLAFSGGLLHLTVHGFPGQEVAIMASEDLANWTVLETHTFTGTTWEFVDAEAGMFARRFYRASLK
jgi:hypothetical protein